MLTAELKFSHSNPNGTGWLVAASFLHNTSNVTRETGRPGYMRPLTGFENRIWEATVFGETTFSPLDHLNVSVGGRVSHSNLAGKAQDPVLPSREYDLDPGARASRTETIFLPSLAVAYQPSSALTLFARFQKGFRPGGIAVRREYIEGYQSDRVQAFEAGFRLRQERFDLEGSASWADWNNIQADVIDGFGFPVTTNAGDGRILSIGLSGRWRPVAGLEIDGAIYLNRSKVTGASWSGYFFDTGTLTQSKDRLPNVIGTSGRIGFSYTDIINENLSLELSGHGRYVGKSVLGVGEILNQPQGDYVDTNLEAALRVGRVRYSLAISNLLDAQGNRFALGSPFEVRDRLQITPLKPRSVRIGLEYAF